MSTSNQRGGSPQINVGRVISPRQQQSAKTVRASAEAAFQNSPKSQVRRFSESLERHSRNRSNKSNAVNGFSSDSKESFGSPARPGRRLVPEDGERKPDTELCFQRGFALLKKIGEGGQAVVYAGKAIGHDMKVAIKIHRAKSQNAARKGPIAFLLSMKPSPYLCHVIDVFERVDAKGITHQYMVSELCPGRDALSYLISRSTQAQWQDRCMSEEETKPIIWGMLQAVNALHERGAIHRDVKPENLMYEPTKKVCKLVDYGHLLRCPRDGHVKRVNQGRGAGTLFYRAPETTMGYFSTACDAWGVGVSMFTLLFAYVPFRYHTSGDPVTDDEEEAVILRGLTPKVIKGVGPWFPAAITVSPAALHLMSGLLKSDVAGRMSVSEAMESAWFKDMPGWK